MLRNYIKGYEYLLTNIYPACSQAAGFKVAQSLTILDLTDASMRMLNKRVYGFIKISSQVAQDYYPEILGRMFIVNAPTLFTMVWKVVKPWLDKRTQNKIKIMGKKF